MKGDRETHGKMSTRANGSHSRECAVHGQHGLLYACPEYPPVVLAEIETARQKYLANLADPVWRAKQLANGVPPAIVGVFQAMAGVDP